MTDWLAHLVIVPILLPLLAGTLMLLFDGRSRAFKAMINVVATASLVVLSVVLLGFARNDGGPIVYLLGDWAAPFGIVLVLDRLAAMMLLLTSILGFASLSFSLARWHSAGVHFHPLFQFLLMGLNGAFLTGDLFNLFVFFEVLLAASYGLALHGSGAARVRAGMHYIAINLAASLLFLIGVSLIYGVTGTLNMADLAVRIAEVPAEDRVLLEAGAAILGIVFLVKAGMWPLGFWLLPAYSAACPPVAAIFAIMSKVGVYVVLRLWLLLLGDSAGSSAGFGGDLLLYGGLMTVAFGTLGALAAQDAVRLGCYSLLISSGTLLAAVGIDHVGVTAGALFYLVSSTLTVTAFFLLTELVERGREFGADMLALTREAFGEGDEEEAEGEEEVGIAVPATLAILGLSFLGCAVLIAGLPPLSGFIAKFALLATLLQTTGSAGPLALPAAGWAFAVLLILSGLAVLIAMARTGIRSLWGSPEREVPRVRIIEIAPIGILLLLCVTLTVQAEPAMRYMEATARALHAPSDYVQGVLAAQPVQVKAKAGEAAQ